MKFIAISEVKNADLVKFWNANFEGHNPDFRAIKKFSDSATAQKRVDALVGYLTFTNDDGETLNVPEGFMPAPEGYEGFDAPDDWINEEVKQADVKKAVIGANAFTALAQTVQAASDKAEASGDTFMGKRDADTKASNSDGVAASWLDGEVRTSRLKRDGVSVHSEGVHLGFFKSTYEAFRELRLPNNKHIRFRLKLKEAFRDKGEGATFDHNGKKFFFEIVPAEEPAEAKKNAKAD